MHVCLHKFCVVSALCITVHVTPCLGIVTVDFQIRQLMPEAEQIVRELINTNKKPARNHTIQIHTPNHTN